MSVGFRPCPRFSVPSAVGDLAGVPASLSNDLLQLPASRATAVLLRHAARDELPPDGSGREVAITRAGRVQAAALGELISGRLVTLHSSPVPRCVQTAEALLEGAGLDLPIEHDALLGDPGAYVIDGDAAWANWQRLGHEGVIEYLMTGEEALPGMASPK